MKQRLPIAGPKLIRAAIKRTQAEIDDPDSVTGLTSRSAYLLTGGALTVNQIRSEARQRIKKLKGLLSGVEQ